MPEVVEQVVNDSGVVQGLFVWCEGCDSRHYIPVVEFDTAVGKQVAWKWNNSLEAPTFSPSILVYEYPGHQPRCHSYIHGGDWEYLGDCTHSLAGTERPLLERDRWPEDTWPNS